MFKCFKEFLVQLQVHLEATIMLELKEILIKILTQLLLTIGLNTMLMREGHVCE